MNKAETIRAIINRPNTYIGEAPIDVANCQWIRLNAGDPQTFFGKDVYEHMHFMIMARGELNAEVKTRIFEIYYKLQNFVGTEFAIVMNRIPHYVGRDDKDRAIYGFSLDYQSLPQKGV